MKNLMNDNVESIPNYEHQALESVYYILSKHQDIKRERKRKREHAFIKQRMYFRKGGVCNFRGKTQSQSQS